MPAAAVILRDLAYIYLSFGTQAYFKLLRTYLMEKDCDFNTLCLTQLAYDPFKIRGLRLKKISWISAVSRIRYISYP